MLLLNNIFYALIFICLKYNCKHIETVWFPHVRIEMIEKCITLKLFQECRLVTCTRDVVTIDLHMICMMN